MVSAISITGALVLPDVMQGMAEASITRKRATPRTRHSESKTVLGSSTLPDGSTLPITQVLTG